MIPVIDPVTIRLNEFDGGRPGFDGRELFSLIMREEESDRRALLDRFIRSESRSSEFQS